MNQTISPKSLIILILAYAVVVLWRRNRQYELRTQRKADKAFADYYGHKQP